MRTRKPSKPESLMYMQHIQEKGTLLCKNQLQESETTPEENNRG